MRKEKKKRRLEAGLVIQEYLILERVSESNASLGLLFFKNAYRGNHFIIKPNFILKLKKAATSLR